ncbi:CAMK family protein kinase [Trichomonas vaginalis G3]|uniref:CAMK family protein kinase n=1 Tax=Trichomonas vaginalis (strain ATCC PRA-98 / G3) TaxID=412133 RepID=A2ERI4_TRIV3|nr:STKc AMPK-like domain-containing protein [Trichomonas vaginalis G3]EAY04711.1 CAMK family protein kinase [Trichomonas vaginalis G3]KAI5526809.1 STKc AMPK-like domain-containing protein [Trichomonas vaginalis G3]|eukprot:XP_001316934.1 CAMK family protein kinase [Trichomonas vaginalis G3]
MSTWTALPAFIGKYNFGQTIGKGSFSLVKMAMNTDTHEKLAIKIIPKSMISTPEEKLRFEREVNVIIKMNHPGIIKIHDFIIDANYFYLVMDYCSGGTLLSQVGINKLTEDAAKPLFKQILETVHYIHSQGIAHRDLKLENIMLDEFGHIKIIDFGFSRFVEKGEMFMTPCGSPAYAPPEVIDGEKYDGKLADLWSLGVILFALVTGELPWKGTNQIQIYNQIRNAQFDIPPQVSKFAQDLINQLLRIDPTTRLTTTEILTHPWLDGIIVSWNGSNGALGPNISFNTFRKILGSGDIRQVQSPRSQLAALSRHHNTVINKNTGSLSFGCPKPSPILTHIGRNSTIVPGLGAASRLKVVKILPTSPLSDEF